MFTRMRSGRVIQICHNKIPDRGCEQGCEWRHAPEAWAEIWDLGEARRICALRAPRVSGVESWRCKNSQHRRIVSLFPHVEKPLNSKVIKSFVPELRSRKCFCVSGFLCYLYMSYKHSMYISHIHVWVCYRKTNNF